MTVRLFMWFSLDPQFSSTALENNTQTSRTLRSAELSLQVSYQVYTTYAFQFYAQVKIHQRSFFFIIIVSF